MMNLKAIYKIQNKIVVKNHNMLKRNEKKKKK